MKRYILTVLCLALASHVWAGNHTTRGMMEPSRWKSLEGYPVEQSSSMKPLPVWMLNEEWLSDSIGKPSLSVGLEIDEQLSVQSSPKLLQTAQVELVALPIYIINVSSLQLEEGAQLRFHNGYMRYKFDVSTKEVWASVMNGTTMAWRPVHMDSLTTRKAMNDIFREATGRNFI